MRRTPAEDVVDVELVGDDGRTVELGGGGDGPRRRRPELLLVVLAIAVVLALIAIDGGDGGSVAAPPTSTTTERRTTTTRRTTSTRVPRPTTTTSWPQLIAGTGPLLPATTGTAVALVELGGTIVILDLDTGDRCRTAVDRDGAWLPWSQAMRRDVIVQTNRELVVVDRQCALRELGFGTGDSWVTAAGSETVWLGGGDTDQHFVEHSIVDEQPTGREITLPGNTSVYVVVLDDRAVFSVSGEMTLVEPDDRRRSIGTGTPLAGAGDVLLYLTCPELRCTLIALDVDRGRRTTIDATPSGWETPALSPDGRWARVSVDRSGLARPALLDLGTGAVRELSTRLQLSVFSADGRWLLAVEGDHLLAAAVDDPDAIVELDADLRQAESTLVALQR